MSKDELETPAALDRSGPGDGLAVVDTGEGAAVAVVRGGRLQRLLSFDEAMLVAAQRFRGPWRTTVARALTGMGDARTWTVLGLALLGTFTPKGTHLGLRLAVSSGLATVLSQGLKRSLTRARPDAAIAGFEALAQNPDRFSFPSGHTAAAFAVAVGYAGEPWGLGPMSCLLATGIGLSRVYLGAHYPLDVLAGGVLGVFAGLAARLVVP